MSSAIRPGLVAPGTAATATGCARENCRAAALTLTPWRAVISLMRRTRSTTSGGASWYSKWVPPHEDPGAVGTADDHADALLLRFGQQPLQRARVVQQGVAAREQEPVGLRLVQVQRQLDGLDPVHTEAPGLDDALVAEPGQHAEGAGAGLLELVQPQVAVEVLGDVVHPDDVQAVDAEALQAALDRPLRGVGGPLVEHRVRTPVLEQPALLAEVAGARLGLVQDDAAHLAGQYERVAGLLREQLAEPKLREARAVEGGRVVEADALVPGGLQGGAHLLLGDGAEHVAEGAVPKPRRPGMSSLSDMMVPFDDGVRGGVRGAVPRGRFARGIASGAPGSGVGRRCVGRGVHPVRRLTEPRLLAGAD